MIYKVILFVIISCLSGLKRPIYGGLAGLISAPVLSVIYSPFDLPTVLVLAAFGFGFGLVFGRVSWWLFRGSGYNQQQSKKPYVMPITRAGGGQRGEIIYTDEEAKSAEENKRPIK